MNHHHAPSMTNITVDLELYDDASNRAAEIRQHLEAGDYEGACDLVDTEQEWERYASVMPRRSL